MAIMSEYSIVPQTREQKLAYKRQYRVDNLKEQREYQMQYYHKNKKKISDQRKVRYAARKAAMKETELINKK